MPQSLRAADGAEGKDGAPKAAVPTIDPLAKAQSEVSAITAILRARVLELASLKRDHALTKHHVRNVEQINAAAQHDIVHLQGDIARLQGDIARQQGDIARLQGDIARLQGDIARQQGDIARQQGDIETLNTNLKMQGFALAESEAVRAQLLNADYESKAAAAVEIDRVKATAAAELGIERNRAEIAEARLHATAATLHAIRQSKSWRLTAPLRAMIALAARPAPWQALQIAEPCVANGFARVALTMLGAAPRGWILFEFARNADRGRKTPILLRAERPGAPTVGFQCVFGDRLLVRLPDDVSVLMLETEADVLQSGGMTASARPLDKAHALITLARMHPARTVKALLGVGGGVRRQMEILSADYLPRPIDDFERWAKFYDTPTPDDLFRLRARAQTLKDQPTFSVLTPVYNTPPQFLREMIESVRGQAYPHWQLCLADDASPNADVRQILTAAAADDKRIKLHLRKENGNISAASNSALELASGAYLALLDHDDVLPPHALATAAQSIIGAPKSDIFYSDEDKIDANGRRFEPYFKPDWDEELIYAQNYANHLTIYRSALVRELGGFRLGFEGSQDYDLLLRSVSATKGPITHIPHILYHWRLFTGAGTFSLRHFEVATAAARRAIKEKFAADGIDADVIEGHGGYHRLIRPAPKVWPKVSVIVPTRDHADVLRPCVTGLLEQTDYPDVELIVVDNGSVEKETFALFSELEARPNARVLAAPGPFNFSRLNNMAAREATGEIILLLNNDISMIGPGWLKEMVVHALRPEVGAVGARLLYPDGTLQHGGVVLGLGGVAGHIQCGAAATEPGYFGRLHLAHETSCVTAACLATRRDVFEELGGLDEANLAVAFNDVDFCVRIREKDYKIIWTPHAELTHWESKSRGSDSRPDTLPRFQREVGYMRARWGKVLDQDPYFNPNLDLFSNVPRPAFPPRVARPWS